MVEATDTVTGSSAQDKRLAATHRDGLRSPGLLGRWPLVGLLMILLGGSLFGVLAVSVQTHGSLVQYDAQIAAALHAVALHSSALMRDLMIAGFYLGEHGIVVIGVALGLYLLYRRFWPELGMIVIAWGGEGVLWTVLSQYFGRPRPVFDVPVWHQMTSPGFPSGHSFSAVLCFGLLAYLVAPKMASPLGKAVVIVAAVLVMLFIGFSRLFVGDHYLTDVLAGYGLGIAWAGFVYTSIDLISGRHQGEPV